MSTPQQIFDSAVQAADRGDLPAAASSYQAALQSVLSGTLPPPGDERSRLIRSIAFNLAQVLNKLGRHREALVSVDLGLEHHPTPFGKAIALAARGEALYGLRQPMEGKATFEEAVRAHPIVGRLNSADAMVRSGLPELESLAEQWVDTVVDLFGSELNESLQAEVASIRRQIHARRNNQSARATDEQPKELVARAIALARAGGQLEEAADLLERALTKFPELRERYEYQLQLWRKGIVM